MLFLCNRADGFYQLIRKPVAVDPCKFEMWKHMLDEVELFGCQQNASKSQNRKTKLAGHSATGSILSEDLML